MIVAGSLAGGLLGASARVRGRRLGSLRSGRQRGPRRLPGHGTGQQLARESGRRWSAGQRDRVRFGGERGGMRRDGPSNRLRRGCRRACYGRACYGRAWWLRACYGRAWWRRVGRRLAGLRVCGSRRHLPPLDRRLRRWVVSVLPAVRGTERLGFKRQRRLVHHRQRDAGQVGAQVVGRCLTCRLRLSRAGGRRSSGAIPGQAALVPLTWRTVSRQFWMRGKLDRSRW